jgi:hypothetical protein
MLAISRVDKAVKACSLAYEGELDNGKSDVE